MIEGTFVQGAAFRHTLVRRRTVIGWALVVLTLGTGMAVTTLSRPTPRLLWNASSSSSVGLYAVGARDRLKVGDMVVAWAPRRAARIAAQRSYLPEGVPLVKQIAATAGARVCAKGSRIFIGGRVVATRRSRDPAGRGMPTWSGCARLQRGDLFLLSPAGPLAFDGRYFGVTRASDALGKATLLWNGRMKVWTR